MLGVVVGVVVVATTVWLVTRPASTTTASPSDTGSATSTSTEPTTPCSYPAAGTAAKEVSAPANLSPLNSGTVDVTLAFNSGDVPVTLDRTDAPCTVNSFLSLASQGFYDATDCWRVTDADALKILQCGDPSGKGNGGPGYTFADEAAVDPTSTATTQTYPAGTVAMANTGPGTATNGSQFFIVYADSTLPPGYTVFGQVSADGLGVIQAIGAKGAVKNVQDGPPSETVTLTSVSVPEGSLDGTGSYPTTTAADPNAVPTDPGLETVPSEAVPSDPATEDPTTGDPATSEAAPTS
ncbi:peptidylprolyl isomerase [Nakamurella flavida]|uniref:Peptidylprolyl isomerase n=1 Tax=Nakamurella flavida TaxID=363630 RepID=A0A939C3T8_9ACTN|nr:peptidylprolyl isomerase [Nakamurella flavida]